MYPNDTSRLASLDAVSSHDYSAAIPYKGGDSKAAINNGVIATSRVVSAVLKFHFT
jgi:hypothetical protein